MESREAEPIEDSNADPGGPIRRACDPCRARKIRCDRETPCSNCQRARIECKHAGASRLKEKRTRVLISPQYERKIDLIDRRLDGLVQLLGDLRTQLTPPAPVQLEAQVSASTTSIATPATSSPSSHVKLEPGQAPEAVVEGESSLAAQSIFANDFLENALTASPLRLEMDETLDALRHIVGALKQPSSSNEMTYQHARASAVHTTEQMPPMEKTAFILRWMKESPTFSWTTFIELLPFGSFTETCLKVYFSQDYSSAEFIIINVGLQYFNKEYASCSGQPTKDEFLHYSNICRDNVETALSRLPLHLPATYEMILALAFGAAYCIEISKPSLAWTLTSSASQLCQTLGYHRASSMKDDPPALLKSKRYLFRAIYILDKNLSLRLGRSSTIPDYDITVPLSEGTGDGITGAMSEYFSMWAMTARMQGKTYAQLYSPGAASQPTEARNALARQLAAEMEQQGVACRETNEKYRELWTKTFGANMVEIFIFSDEVVTYSCLTLIYRAISPASGSATTFDPACIEAARNALARHQSCMDLLSPNFDGPLMSIYLHWTILLVPFVPFIVIFCQVIETGDTTDLARLHDFVTSIQAATVLSDAVAKLHRLFHVLYNVALRYLEVRSSSLPSSSTAPNELDEYLAALGIVPPTMTGGVAVPSGAAAPVSSEVAEMGGLGVGGEAVEGMDGGPTQNAPFWMGQGSQLGDWFNSHQQMMGLLEENDLSFML